MLFSKHLFIRCFLYLIQMIYNVKKMEIMCKTPIPTPTLKILPFAAFSAATVVHKHHLDTKSSKKFSNQYRYNLSKIKTAAKLKTFIPKEATPPHLFRILTNFLSYLHSFRKLTNIDIYFIKHYNKIIIQ